MKVSVSADYPDEKTTLTATRGARGAKVSPDGKQVAFTYRGDVYVTSVDYATTKQITDTPGAEAEVVWGNDSTLYYTSDRGGLYNIYRATFEKSADEPDFAHATIINEEPVFKADSHERTVPEVSPDGKKLGFILDRTNLCVMDLKSKNVKQLTTKATHAQRSGGFDYLRSPTLVGLHLKLSIKNTTPTRISLLSMSKTER